MLVIILGPNLPDQSKGQFHVHAANCADLKRGWQKRYAEQERAVDYKSRVELSDDIYADIMDENPDYKSGDLVSEFYFLPCCDNLPMEA